MAFRIESAHLDGIVVVVPEVHGDSRGFFMEAFRADQFAALGLPSEFVQDNHSRSGKGVVRGLHFQWDPPMGKLMRVHHLHRIVERAIELYNRTGMQPNNVL